MAKMKKHRSNVWMKYDRQFEPLRRVIKQKNFCLRDTINALRHSAPEALINFVDNIDKIGEFLDQVHDKAIKEAVNRYGR